MNISVINYDILDSTNSEALKQARLGAAEGLCISARQQTAGRGRHGRIWISEVDAGLCFSIILRPKIETKYLPLITLMSGIAVHQTLKELGLNPDIKWVNDILINDKKICGILAETTDSELGLAVIVGIGLNILSSNYPPEMTETATSIENESASQTHPSTLKNQLISILIANISKFYHILSQKNGHLAIVDDWSKRSSFVRGKEVRVNLHDEVFTGITDGLEESGALKLILPDGSVRIINSGEVGRVRAQNI